MLGDTLLSRDAALAHGTLGAAPSGKVTCREKAGDRRLLPTQSLPDPASLFKHALLLKYLGWEFCSPAQSWPCRGGCGSSCCQLSGVTTPSRCVYICCAFPAQKGCCPGRSHTGRSMCAVPVSPAAPREMSNCQGPQCFSHPNGNMTSHPICGSGHPNPCYPNSTPGLSAFLIHPVRR